MIDMDIVLHPSKLRGTVAAIPSKSMAHRALICAALSDNQTSIGISGMDILSDDINVTMNCLRALGAHISEADKSIFHVSPINPTFLISPVLDCYESGSTLRFLLPVAASLYPMSSFIGRGRLPERPLLPLIGEMEKNGCTFSSSKLPLDVLGRMKGGTFEIPGNISSQFISGLLLALPLIGGGDIVLTSPAESKSYINMTIHVLKSFGINVIDTPTGYSVQSGHQYISPGNYSVEGDWSNAAFWLCANTLGNSINCTGLDASSTQGDKAIQNILELQLCEIDASGIPDLVPILSVVASVTPGKTVIYNAGRLRIKESDRLHSISDCLNRIGGDVKTLSDGLEITGVPKLTGGRVSSYSDHRIAMSMAIASTVCAGDIILEGADAVRKSYPLFFEDFNLLGGKYDVINNR